MRKKCVDVHRVDGNKYLGRALISVPLYYRFVAKYGFKASELLSKKQRERLSVKPDARIFLSSTN
jgi:hypothetical protein